MNFDIKAEDPEEDEDQVLSYVNLKSSLAQTHPANDENRKYSIFMNLGSFPLFSNTDQFGNTIINISDVQMEIGLGPCLMLNTSKALTILFLILTIVNLPMFIFFNSGRSPSNGLTQSTATLPNIFYKLSIGNLGEDEISCSSTEMKAGSFDQVQISCEFGQLVSLLSLGILNEGNHCKQVLSYDFENIGLVQKE